VWSKPKSRDVPRQINAMLGRFWQLSIHHFGFALPTNGFEGVRRRDSNDFNARTLDVGTANSIHLRHTPGPMADGESVKGSEIVPAAKIPGEAIAALEFDPTAISVAQGATFMLDVVLSGAQNVRSVPLEVTYVFISQRSADVHSKDMPHGTLSGRMAQLENKTTEMACPRWWRIMPRFCDDGEDHVRG
jgi:hypothetical protein